MDKQDKKEQRLIGGAIVICALFLGYGFGVRAWNYLPPRDFESRTAPAINGLDTFAAAKAASRAMIWNRDKNGLQTGEDLNSDWTGEMFPYTRAYNARFPINNKAKYLAANAKSWALWKAALGEEWLLPEDRFGFPNEGFISPARQLVFTTARAQWQQGRAAQAANTLLDWPRFRARVYRSRLAGEEFSFEMSQLLPNLDAATLRQTARQWEQIQARADSPAKQLERWRDEDIRFFYRAVEGRDYRLLWLPKTSIQPEPLAANRAPHWRFFWLHKKGALQSKIAGWNRMIQEAELAPSQRVFTKKLMREQNIAFEAQTVDFAAPFASVIMTRGFDSPDQTARERLLLVEMALRAYRLEHSGQNPTTLEKLVPRYLQSIPRDPFSPAQTLRYSPRRFDYLAEHVVVEVFEKVPLRKRRISFPPGTMIGPLGHEHPLPPIWVYVPDRRDARQLNASHPYTLYSIGKNERDDGGYNPTSFRRRFVFNENDSRQFARFSDAFSNPEISFHPPRDESDDIQLQIGPRSKLSREPIFLAPAKKPRDFSQSMPVAPPT